MKGNETIRHLKSAIMKILNIVHFTQNPYKSGNLKGKFNLCKKGRLKSKQTLQVMTFRGKGTLLNIKPRICHLVIYRFLFFFLKLIAKKPGLQWSRCNNFDKIMLK